MNIRSSRHLALLTLIVCAFALTGCSSKSSSGQTGSRKGIVKTIDLANRKVVMTCVIKGGEERDIAGTYTDETIVQINGRNMSIKDIKEGDNVEVVGRKEGSGTDAQLIALKVIVTRQDGDWEETGKGGDDAKPQG